MGFVFDSDTFRLFADGNEAIVRRVEENLVVGGTVVLSAVAAEEAIRGALAEISVRQKQANATPASMELAYDFLT